jgi:uncharacterized protein YceH (UPF0502 family)
VSAVLGSTARIEGLSPEEIRVLGCLLEKQRTTPDQYPLSLNALRLACNQATNREPVVDYDEATARDALHRLERRRLVRLASGAGSRAAKYRHLLAEALPLDEDERAVLAVLMLRGSQTPGELKQRAERMHAFADLAGVNDTLRRLVERSLVRRLDRRPGQKEERYAQLLGDDTTAAGRDVGHGGAFEAGGGRDASDPAPDRVREAASLRPDAPLSELAALRERVERLEREVAALRAGGAGNGPTMRNASLSAPDATSTDDARSPDPRR